MALQRRAGWRAIQGAQHAKEMLESGFTTVRDLGNSGDHLDTDLEKAIRSGLIPGPTMIFSGRIIAPLGGQFWDTPTDSRLLDNAEYFDRGFARRNAQSRAREHLLGARASSRSSWMDRNTPILWTTSVSSWRKPAARAYKVAAHVQTESGGRELQ